MFKYSKIVLLLAGLILIALITASPAMAQEPTLSQPVDFVWFLPAALTLFLPIGSILMISSAMPEAKAPATAMQLFVTWGLAALAYFGVGFAFHFGGIAQVTPEPDLRGLYWEWYPLDQSVDVEIARLWGVIALRGWALLGEAATPGALRLFLSHLSLVGAAAMIPAGALAYRNRQGVAAWVGLLTGGLIYPVAGNWLWGGGWLSHLGSNLGLGHGLVDFGGAGVVFLAGSGVALLALIFFRPGDSQQRLGGPELLAGDVENQIRVDQRTAGPVEQSLPEFRPMPSAYLPILSMLGGALMLLGWFGLATGIHTPTALNFTPAQAAVAGLLAALAGALTAAGYSRFTTPEFNPLMTARGLVAGLVVAAAGAPFIPLWIVVIAALFIGLCLPPLIYLFDHRLRLADGLGLIPTYGLSAIVSLFLIALAADGSGGQGWNGVGPADYRGVAGQGVSGLWVGTGFAPDWPEQFEAQLLGSSAILAWALISSFLLFQAALVVTNIQRRGNQATMISSSPALSHQGGAGESPDNPAEEDPTTTQEIAQQF